MIGQTLFDSIFNMLNIYMLNVQLLVNKLYFSFILPNSLKQNADLEMQIEV